MQIFLEALENKVRIQTTAGLLDLYQLMSLDVNVLNDKQEKAETATAKLEDKKRRDKVLKALEAIEEKEFNNLPKEELLKML